MVTTLVLLDEALTFRAWFGISPEPGHVFSIVFLLKCPLCHLMARSWLMVLFLALEAKRVSAVARNDIDHAEVT